MKFNLDGKEVEVADEVLAKAIEDKTESIDVKIEGLTIRTAEEETTFKANTKADGVAEGAEVGRKDVLKRLEIEPNGAHKDTDKTISAINIFAQGKIDTALTDAKIEPDKKVLELTEQINTLKGTITKTEGERDTAIGNHTAFKQNITKNKSLVKNMPSNMKHSSDDMLLIMNSKLNTGFNDSGVLVGFNEDGSVMKDSNTGDPLAIKEVVKGFFDSNTEYISDNSGGAGGGDSGGQGGKQTMDAFFKEMQKEGVELNSKPYLDEMSKRIENGSLEA